MKAESPSERILVQDILNYVQQIIIDEQRAGRAIEDEALREQMKGCSLGTPARTAR